MPEPENYGDFGFSLSTLQKLRLLMDWAPLLALMEGVVKASGNQGKALAGVQVLRFLASKTSTPTDDKALDHLEAMLKTPEGAAIADFLVALVGAFK